MEPIAVALVLASAVFHAGWNRLLHDESDRLAALAVAGLFGGMLLLPAIVIAPPTNALPLVGLSAFAELIYSICLAAAYQRGALSLAYPVGRGTAPFIVTLGAWLVLRQAPTVEALGGASALGVGLLLVGARGVTAARGPALSFAVLTGLSIAAYSLVDARAVQVASPAGYLGAVYLLQGLLLSGWVGVDWARWKKALRPGIIIGLGTVIAYLLVLLAFQRAHAGPVATLRSVSVLFGLIIARERPHRIVWVGAGLVVIGAVFAAT